MPFPGYENVQSTYDFYQRNLSGASGGTLYFTGANAEALYGGRVALTYATPPIWATTGRAMATTW